MSELAAWGTVVGIVSALFGAAGAGVGVYVALRLEIAELKRQSQESIAELKRQSQESTGELRRTVQLELVAVQAEVDKIKTVYDVRLVDLEGDLRAIGTFARQHTRPADL